MGLKIRTSFFVLGRIVSSSKPFPTYGFHSRLFSTNNTPKTSKPLRILFCGSDDFSCESLRSLVAEQQSDPKGIASIDVLIRPGKRFGRGLRETREVPLREVAEELNLPIHERDTFTGWDLPKPNGESINLIVAVSFGLFVPPRILNSAEYGGINVHPSLLPQYRGSAPIHHAIINGDTITGVTLQTLDPHKFDHGTILSQEGFPIPQPRTINYQGLLDFVTPKAADLLAKGVRNRVFVNPESDQAIKPAPKISPVARYINWEEGLSADVERRHRALGRLWCYTRTWWSGKNKKRTIFHDFEVVPLPKQSVVIPERVYNLFPSWEYFCTPVYADPTHPGSIIIPTVQNGVGLRVKQILVEGQVVGSAIDVVHKVSGFTKDPNDDASMFMSVALTDISEDGQPVLREGKGVEYAAKHLLPTKTLKINRARLIDPIPKN
ncbi:hypothetical protein SS1G_03801 [Sclerotinia sclerotiorum 1980 UF-70]|uniref:methionyl-tRNA formyltransferase n=2 Tax=Sclerotinia sclerotiorum (strain ATCC 18683 / 1980 / Ss-1) TaxID=665079 RepID=A7EER1_SCLS1|nr:hypothetical protein SS1G_03801 [Sclerotinia sclerotiorum 1980 UF-70]APA12559.1 hypothetical protein sscle_09g073290 [Sclerotinia sclerotiorum 1980 UF-70]EDO01327.1 hypothetical protein SS1G_03801 [Sclerotinia sclerotiorum 1980 UF-70]